MAKFKPDCTLPPPNTRFVSSPTVRGTLDILWSCLSIFVLCTWSIYHPNLPVQACPKNWKQRLRKQSHLFYRKIRFFVVMLFMPEAIIAFAAIELHSAVITLKKARTENKDWTLADSFLLDMGGFAICFPEDDEAAVRGSSDEPEPSNLPTSHLHSPRDPGGSIGSAGSVLSESGSSHNSMTGTEFSEHVQTSSDSFRELGSPLPSGDAQAKRAQWFSQYVPLDRLERNTQIESLRMGQTGWYRSDRNLHTLMEVEYDWPEKLHSRHQDEARNLASLQADTWILNAAQIQYAKDRDIIAQHPQLTTSDLEDRNKGSYLVKGLAVLQVSWLIAQVSARVDYGLPSTQLEIATLAYAACALVIYVLFWEKPQDIKNMSKVKAQRFATAKEMMEIAKIGPRTVGYRQPIRDAT
ncbi:vegetative incompatibility protein 3a [Diplodia corticola]|uniref:Vegetative incompatibility protein 3a n=1 Tax=Diplodia corticola TaxID=236234 RepID=A0A1J9QQW9_9PEZI|nr:vegetative incompatibility protein 3a [Diplodia corticola]OJD30410.1 vegetative incompatibility protein 3a [Diplodia corticola]